MNKSEQQDGAIGRFVRLFALVSGWILMLLMLGTVVDVALRYIFNAPFSGSLEITEFAMALIVWLSMAYCGWSGGHIAVDLLDRWLDRPGLAWLQALLSLVGAALFMFMSIQIVIETLDTLSKMSNMMRIPHYPFKLAVAFGAAMFSLVLLVQAFSSWRGKAN